MTNTSATAVRRVALVQTSPSLQTTRELGPFKIHVPGREVLHDLDLARVLSDAAESDAHAIVNLAIRKVDIGAVLLERYSIVAVVYYPAEEGDVVCVDLEINVSL